jgi:hypothetical protein
MALGRIADGLRGERRRGALLADPARIELLDVATLADLAQGDVPALEPRGARRAAAALDHTVLLRELARRTGDPNTMEAAIAAADRAALAAGPERRLYAAARLQAAMNALTAADIFGGADAAATAEAALGDAESALECQPGRLNGPGLVRARLDARRALARLDRNAVLAACTRFDDAALALEARTRATGAGEPEWAAALCEKAELVLGFASARKDMGLLDRSVAELSQLSSRLSPTRLPLSWMRAQTLHGCSLRALGEITGEARLMKEAARALGAAYDAVPAGHSPLDRARAAHGLGLALAGLAEASGERLVYSSAQAAFDRALAEMGPAHTPLRSTVAYDRAVGLARRAERTGDAQALGEAERAFREDLATRSAAADPVGWAVIQLALARVYLSRADLIGDSGERADAAFALTEALEVFTEHGQPTLADVALAALAKLKGRPRG